MTFPTIPTVAAGRVLTSTGLTCASGQTFPSLSSLTKNSGDLLIAIVIIYDGNSTNAEFSSWGGGFTEFVDQATTATMGIGAAYKWSDGTETGTFTVTSADTSTNDYATILLSIAGAHASTPPEGGTIANNTAAAADPGSFNPTGWDAEDTLWIAVAGSGETSLTGSYTGIASAPANYTGYADTGMSADAIGAVEGAVAFRQLNAASEDVGGFSVDTSNAKNSALVIAVRPAPPVYNESRDESVAAADTQTGLLDTAVSARSESVAVADSQTAGIEYSSTRDESIAVADSQSAQHELAGPHSESIAVADSQSSLIVAVDTRAESIAVADSQSSLLDSVNTRAESIAAADSQAGAIITAGAVSESIAPADSQSSLLTSVNTRAESVGVADSQEATVDSGGTTYNESVSESVGVADLQSSALVTAGAVSESIAVADSQDGTLPQVYNESVSETIGIVDSQTGSLAAEPEPPGGIGRGDNSGLGRYRHTSPSSRSALFHGEQDDAPEPQAAEKPPLIEEIAYRDSRADSMRALELAGLAAQRLIERAKQRDAQAEQELNRRRAIAVAIAIAIADDD